MIGSSSAITMRSDSMPACSILFWTALRRRAFLRPRRVFCYNTVGESLQRFRSMIAHISGKKARPRAPNMKRITSISLGSSARDKAADGALSGRRILHRARRHERRHGPVPQETGRTGRSSGRLRPGRDGHVHLGGGPPLHVPRDREAGERRRQNPRRGRQRPQKHAGARDRRTACSARASVDFAHSKVLLVSGVDRFGMAEALAETGASVVYGDFMFALGLPIPLRSLGALQRAARALLPARHPYALPVALPDRREAEHDHAEVGEILRRGRHHRRRLPLSSAAICRTTCRARPS